MESYLVSTEAFPQAEYWNLLFVISTPRAPSFIILREISMLVVTALEGDIFIMCET